TAAGIVQIAAVATGVDKNGDNAMELSPSEKALLTITVPQPKIVITEQKITFAEKAITKTYGDGKFISIGTNDKADGGAVTYVSSNPLVATVNPQSGEVTILANGLTSITATAAPVNEKYSEGKNSYTLTVGEKEITPAMLGAISDVTYTGAEFKPEPIITDAVPLVKGVDFTFTYENNINAGTAKVIVTGMGKYKGTVNKSFTILKKPLTPAAFNEIAPLTYTGGFLEPALTASNTEKGNPRLNIDYTASYSDNKLATQNGRKAIVTVSAMANGNYVGSTTKEFIINKAAAPAVAEKVLYISKGESKNYSLDLNTLYLPSDAGNKTYYLGALYNAYNAFYALPRIEGNMLTYKTNSMPYAVSPIATQYITIVSENYGDVAVGIRFDVTNQRTVTVSGINVGNKTYDGAYATVSGTPRAQLDGKNINVSGFDYTWKKSADGTTLVPNSAPRDAGSYVLTVSVRDNSASYVGFVDIPFIITKANIKAVANSHVVYKEWNKDVTLPRYNVITTSLVGNDS
ncbi:MAG: Ig-like domain-containing protein, partial [Oscillospiraceae bacterium]